jgi:hypothetical protein
LNQPFTRRMRLSFVWGTTRTENDAFGVSPPNTTEKGGSTTSIRPSSPQIQSGRVDGSNTIQISE